MQRKSLGLIETWGHVPAVEAVDAGCKAASVVLAGYEEIRAGLVTITFTGDVASVQTAVAAGTAAARRVGKVVSCHVIARPDQQLQAFSTPPAVPGPASTPPPTPPTTAPGQPERTGSPLPEASSTAKETTKPPDATPPAAEETAGKESSSAAGGKKPARTRRKKKA